MTVFCEIYRIAALENVASSTAFDTGFYTC